MPRIETRRRLLAVLTCGFVLAGCTEKPDYGGEAPSVEALQDICGDASGKLAELAPDDEVDLRENSTYRTGWSYQDGVECHISVMGPDSTATIRLWVQFIGFKDGETNTFATKPFTPGCDEPDDDQLTDVEISGVPACRSLGPSEEYPSALLRFAVDHVDVRLDLSVRSGEGDPVPAATTLAAFVIGGIRAA